MVLNTITSSVLSSPFSPTTGLDLILFFFFNDTATTEIYTLSLHDALPISHRSAAGRSFGARPRDPPGDPARPRSRHRYTGRRYVRSLWRRSGRCGRVPRQRPTETRPAPRTRRGSAGRSGGSRGSRTGGCR